MLHSRKDNLPILIMLFPTLLLAVLAAAEAPLSRSSLCGTTQIPDNFAKIVSGLSTTENSIKLQSRNIGVRGALSFIDVPVHFHTVSSKAKKDSITDAALNAQYAVLKDTYAQYDINMQWDGTVASRTVDDWLATGNWPLSAEDVAKKMDWLTRVRKGGYNHLNFYFCEFLVVRSHLEKVRLNAYSSSSYRHVRRLLGQL